MTWKGFSWLLTDAAQRWTHEHTHFSVWSCVVCVVCVFVRAVESRRGKAISSRPRTTARPTGPPPVNSPDLLSKSAGNPRTCSARWRCWTGPTTPVWWRWDRRHVRTSLPETEYKTPDAPYYNKHREPHLKHVFSCLWLWYWLSVASHGGFSFQKCRSFFNYFLNFVWK